MTPPYIPSPDKMVSEEELAKRSKQGLKIVQVLAVIIFVNYSLIIKGYS